MNEQEQHEEQRGVDRPQREQWKVMERERANLKDNDVYGRKQGWRNGVSKPHRIPCRLCGGLVHPRGRHYQPAHVKLLLSRQQRESERARACGYQAGQ